LFDGQGDAAELTAANQTFDKIAAGDVDDAVVVAEGLASMGLRAQLLLAVIGDGRRLGGSKDQ
jgi:hypothetical protein